MELDYEKDMGIDETALDIEWLRQPELMNKYVRYQAEMRKRMDQAKERLDYIKARLEKNIRSNPDEYGLGKVTEGSISSTILCQKEYQDASQVHIKAKFENDVAIAAVKAIDQKKTALENLVKLLGVNYFAGPSAPRDLSVVWNEQVKQRSRKENNKNIKITRKRKDEK
ncbi:MAG: hypothetical protein BWX44_00054 [Spirochaetes bacterium ADurb.Bin001]|nr:MAG: hypothetical protein BWX44_00054 [Spirochaetes bacterium ADurb.Bin001]